MLGKLFKVYQWARGKKTYTAMALLFIASGLRSVGQAEAADAVETVGTVLGAAGLADKTGNKIVEVAKVAAKDYNKEDWND